MARRRKIYENEHNYFIIDATFLVDKYIPLHCIPDEKEKQRLKISREWWNKIDSLLKERKTKIYIPDICIAETFKTLAKKRFLKKKKNGTNEEDNNIKLNKKEHEKIRDKLRKEIRTKSTDLAKADRWISIHDLPTTRDIIISLDRFFETCFKSNIEKISIPDLIVIGSAKYLMEFYDMPKKNIYILTSDNELLNASKIIKEIPTAINPREKKPDQYFVRKKH